MHRSGTSLVSQLIQRAGVDFGSPKLFFPADRWNILGYIESAPILDLNSILITGIPRTKSRVHALLSQCIYISMPNRRGIYRRGLKHHRDVSQTGRIYDKLAVKDPRFCLTLPVWKTYANIEKVVVCIRHPHRVALSLRRRQAVPRAIALKFWHYHVRSLLDNISEEQTYFFDVDGFFAVDKLKTLDGMLRFLGADRTDAEKIFHDVFDSTLMRNDNYDCFRLPQDTWRLWQELGETAGRANGPYQ